MKKVIKIIFLLTLAIGWMICIYKLSGMNSKNSNGKSTDIIALFIEDTLDITNEYGITNSNPNAEKLARTSQLINAPMRKVIHAFVYYVLAFFAMILFDVLLEHKKYWITLLITFILCVCFAMGDEYHQTFVAGRTGQMFDVVIDSIGAMVGILFYSTYHIIYKNGYREGLRDKEKEGDNNV